MQAEPLILRLRDFLDDATPNNTIGGYKAGSFWSDEVLAEFLNMSQLSVAAYLYYENMLTGLAKLLSSIDLIDETTLVPSEYMFSLRAEVTSRLTPRWQDPSTWRPASLYVGGLSSFFSSANDAFRVTRKPVPSNEVPADSYSWSVAVTGATIRLHGAPWGRLWYYKYPSRISLEEENAIDYGEMSFDSLVYDAVVYHATACALMKEYESSKLQKRLRQAVSLLSSKYGVARNMLNEANAP